MEIDKRKTPQPVDAFKIIGCRSERGGAIVDVKPLDNRHGDSTKGCLFHINP
jgi:hypothetical protein